VEESQASSLNRLDVWLLRDGYNADFQPAQRAMQDFPRFTINRHLIVLLPKQPALEWIIRVDPNPLDITLEELRQEQDAFLVSDDSFGYQMVSPSRMGAETDAELFSQAG
jgi:hypothetical protein